MTGLFFDTETTGLKTPGDDFVPGLVQMGCILQDLTSGRVLAEINLICTQPEGVLIPEGAMKVHGITDEMAAKYGVDIKLIDIAFAALISKADLIVAHNIDYDMDVVADNMPNSQSRIKNKKQFCTMDNNLYIVKAPLTFRQKKYFSSKGMKPDAPFKRPSLKESFQYYFGEEFEGAHDAMADIRACRDIFLEMIKRGTTVLDGGQAKLL